MVHRAQAESITTSLAATSRLFLSLASSKLFHRPFYLSHLVTTRCNCRCPMCIWRNNRRTDEMSTAEIGRFYRHSRQSGFKAVGIWGGEPLLREDLPEVLALAKREGLITTLLTNGFYLQDRIQEMYREPDSVILSLDYPDEKHDQVRGCKGLFQRVIGALETIRRHYPGIRLMVNCLLHSGNEERTLEIAELCHEMQVSFYVCPVKTNLSPETGQSVKEWKAGLEKEMEVSQALNRLKKNRYPLNNSYTYLERFLEKGQPYVCHLPKIALIIYPDGEVANCADSSNPLGNVRNQSLEDILKGPRFESLKRKALHCNRCNNPNVVESSYMWQLKPEPLWNALRVLSKK